MLLFIINYVVERNTYNIYKQYTLGFKAAHNKMH